VLSAQSDGGKPIAKLGEDAIRAESPDVGLISILLHPQGNSVSHGLNVSIAWSRPFKELIALRASRHFCCELSR
jgi:hypothetical protein